MFRSLSLVGFAAWAVMGCASQSLELPLRGSGDTAVGVSGDYQTTTASKTTSTFPHDDVRTALAAASRGLKACRTGDAPVEVDATLEFAPNGKVKKLKIAPATGPLAECVRADLAQVEIPEFVGPPVAVDLKTTL